MESQEHKYKGLISAMFLVAGCCIGGGMLALPVSSGIGGYFPSLVMMFLCWAAMTTSALLLMEACLWMKEEVHVLTLATKFLGPVGKVIALILFLYISYASEVAYAAGGGVQLSQFVYDYFGIALSKDSGAILVTLIFTTVIVFGGQIVGRANALLFMALIGAFVVLVMLGTGEVKTSYLFTQKWRFSFLAIPLLLTAFSFQTMVPSLAFILKKKTRAFAFAIVGGTTIALVVYIIWQTLILGIVPIEGPNGLLEANVQSVPATQFLREHVNNRWFIFVAEYFGFFAIITSYLAMGLGLFDFLADGMGIKKEGRGNLLLGALIAVPTIIAATQFERAFMIALDTSGGYGDTILNGMFPVMMVWIGRYKMGIKEGYRVPGGKVLLVLTFLFFFASLLLEVLMQAGIIATGYDLYEALEIFNAQEVIDNV